MRKSTATTSESRRQIVHRTRGLRRGAITRLMSPGDLGHMKGTHKCKVHIKQWKSPHPVSCE